MLARSHGNGEYDDASDGEVRSLLAWDASRSSGYHDGFDGACSLLMLMDKP